MSSLSPEMLEADILSMGTEDMHGLYEIVWSLNVSHPTLPREHKITAARSALRSLVDRQWVALHRLRWQPTADLGPVALAAVHAVLNAAESWEPAEEYVGFVATDEGRRRYFGKPDNPRSAV